MKNEKGFTLIELVVSIAVLSMLIVPFFGIFTNAAKLDMRSKKDLTANYLAQQLASEANENSADYSSYWTVSGWTIDSPGTFEKNSLVDSNGNYSEYSAVLTYSDFSPSEPSKDWDEYLANIEHYSAIFDLYFDSSNKIFNFSYEGLDILSEDIQNSSNDPEIFLENSETGFNDFIIRVKISSYQNEYPFTLSENIDSISMKIKLDPNINEDLINKNRQIKIWNNLPESEDYDISKHDKDKARPLFLELYTENFNEFEKIELELKNGDITEHNLDDLSINLNGSDLNYLTIEISGYDPISGTNKVLKKLVTSVRNDG